MSEQHKQTVIRWFEEVWNKGRRDAIDEMLPADCVIHDGEAAWRGPEEFKPFFDRMRASFSDIRVTSEHAIAEGDVVCLRWSVSMRHTGDGMGMPATDKEVSITGMSLVRFADGRFAECWQNWDMYGMMQQINEASKAKAYMTAE